MEKQKPYFAALGYPLPISAIFFALCLLLLHLPGCSAINGKTTDKLPDEPAADLWEIPQDPFFFACQNSDADTALLSRKQQEELTAGAVQTFFSPWDQEIAANTITDAMWGYYWLDPKRGFMENLRPYSLERWHTLTDKANIAHYPNRALRAITVDNCALRLMPTNSPYFFNPQRPGQGYPFDYYQNSSLPVGTPVFIAHISADAAWALIESPSAGGWVEVDKLALVDNDFIIAWKSRKMGAITRERSPLYRLEQIAQPEMLRLFSHFASTMRQANPKATTDNASNVYDCKNNSDFAASSPKENPLNSTAPPEQQNSAGYKKAHLQDASLQGATSASFIAAPRFASIGTILPLEMFPGKYFGGIPQGYTALYYPIKGADGYAKMQKAILPQEAISPWPMELNKENMAGLIAQMMGQPYGWGGYGGNRDCSSSLRELFLVFGAWLPRNSRAQAGLGDGIDLTNLPAEEKENIILQEGRPFLSLVGQPGHIMLYLGQHEGRAIVFHNMWGIRTKQRGTDIEGRAVVGKAVISTLSPGRERRDISRPNSLLDSTNRLSFPLGR